MGVFSWLSKGLVTPTEAQPHGLPGVQGKTVQELSDSLRTFAWDAWSVEGDREPLRAALVKLVDHPSPIIRSEAVHAWVQLLGPEFHPAQVAWLEQLLERGGLSADAGKYLLQGAVKLARVGGVRLVEHFSMHPDARMRGQVARWCGVAVLPVEDSRRLLFELLEDFDASVRAEAAHAAAALFPDPELALRLVAMSRVEVVEEVRINLATSLVRFGRGRDPHVLAAVTRFQNDPRWRVREATEEALEFTETDVGERRLGSQVA